MDAHGPYIPTDEFDVFSKANTTIDERFGLSNEFTKAGLRGDAKRAAELLEPAVDLYDGGIRQADYSVGRVVALLKAKGLYDSSIVIVTADHGEGFLEHGKVWHGNSLYA